MHTVLTLKKNPRNLQLGDILRFAFVVVYLRTDTVTFFLACDRQSTARIFSFSILIKCAPSDHLSCSALVRRIRKTSEPGHDAAVNLLFLDEGKRCVRRNHGVQTFHAACLRLSVLASVVMLLCKAQYEQAEVIVDK